MRRPSTGQHEGDLSRLTSVISTTTPVESSLSPSSQHSDLIHLVQNGNSNTNNNSSNNNNSNNTSTPNNGTVSNSETLSSSSYLPKIIELEWQRQQHQNHRKRKERQDSTSSISQDRKLVRSNSEENVQQSGDGAEESQIRRVVSQEDFKKGPQLPLSENVRNELQQISEVLPKGSTIDENNNQPSVGQGHQNSPIKSTKSHNHSTKRTDEHLSDGEHERRRSSERFSRTRAPPGRKSAGNSSKKSSSGKHHKIRYNVGSVSERDENGYKYDLVSLKCERRGFVSRDSKNRSSTKSKEEKAEKLKVEIGENGTDNSENQQIVLKSPKVFSDRDPLPWNEFPDETPVVCPRFAEDTYDDVVGSHHSIKKDPGNKYVNNENIKTRDIMKKYNSNNISSCNNNNSWTKNRNTADLKLMIRLDPDERVKQINSRLTKLKKRILQYEENVQRDFGYKPARIDTLNDKAMKSIIQEIHKLKKEKQTIKTSENLGVLTPFLNMPSTKGQSLIGKGGVEDIDSNDQIKNFDHLGGDLQKLNKMQETLTDIEMVLQERRKEESRSSNLEDLNQDQLTEEKTAIQRGLLYLESIYGRPCSKEERDLARPLYDRYRQIKRMVNRNSSLLNNEKLAELPTILEHEAMVFTTSTTTPSTDVTPPNSNESPSTDDTSSSINDNLHQLSITELWQQLDTVRDEKKELRRVIKDFEEKFEDENGRKMLKSDRKGGMEETYSLYKQKKGKLRLLDALVKKHMAY